MKQSLNNHRLSIAAVAILILILVAVAPQFLRIAITLPVVLFLPGFALTTILFKRDQLGIPERLLLSVGLSVSLVAIIGLILNWTPWGINPTALVIALLIVLSVESLAILVIRRRRGTAAVNVRQDAVFTARQWILMSLAALVAVVAIFVARNPVDQQGFEGYTTLWVQASDTPDMLQLGVRSEEFETTTYQIQFELNDTVHQGPTLELEPGETWEGLLRIPSDQIDGKKPLTVNLYRLDHPSEVYRHALWWPE